MSFLIPRFRNRSRAFTLIELLVVVAIIGLLISILLPSLARARRQAKSVKCLSNLRTLGQGVVTYASESRDGLPGPLHPAVYRNQGIDALTNNPIRSYSYDFARWFQKRFLTYKLRRIFNDSESQANSITDQVSICPALEQINPDSNFVDFASVRPVFPTDYVLNNVGVNTADEQSGSVNGFRVTNPSYYFGFSSYSQNDPQLLAIERNNPPKKLAKINRAAEEWMIADAWYRPRPNGGTPELQQEGPYQWGWTGVALPNFAPHFSGMAYTPTADDGARNVDSSRIRNGKDDGLTNTVFFDGHAKGVESKTYYVNGFALLYGFPGTVNPAMKSPPEGSAAWNGVWK